jgi:hypothetical protein
MNKIVGWPLVTRMNVERVSWQLHSAPTQGVKFLYTVNTDSGLYLGVLESNVNT